jgi:HSP20 family protein
MSSELTRMVKALFVPATETYQRTSWLPLADIYRGRSGWLVKLDLAGVRPDEIELVVEGRRLTVRGIRRDWCVEEGQHSYSMEISYNRFERSIELPVNVEGVPLRSEYRDGMLLVTLQTEE